MTDTADLNLVLARILPSDALHDRAQSHLESTDTLTVPMSVGMELLFIAHRFDLSHVEALGATQTHFQLEQADLLYTAAEALDTEEVDTVFDAIHLADAFHRSGRLHTTDQVLQKSPFPTQGF